MRSAPVRPILLAAVLLLLAGALARAHDAPLLYITMALDEVELTHQATVRGDLFRDWTGLDPKQAGERFEAEDGEIAAAVAAEYATWVDVEVDGVLVRPVLRNLVSTDIDDHGVVWTYVDLTMVYGVKGRPKQVSMTWRRWDNTLGWEVAPIDAEMEAFGVLEYPLFRRRESQHIWHAPLETDEKPMTLESEPVPTPARVAVPVASVAAAVLGILAVILLRRARPAFRWGPAAVCVALAIGLSQRTLVDVRLPWQGTFDMPEAAEARALFETLHRNVYRAFDYTEEGAIYDTLAETVEGDLLDRLYGEIYHSLILRRAGGAVSRVKGTEILESEIEYPEDPGAQRFDVLTRWQVRGSVTHQGHTHTRLNEYRARFVVRWQGEGWKIADVTILSRDRLPVQGG